MVIPPTGDFPENSEQKPSTEPIQLKVVSQEGNETFYKIRPRAPLAKLMENYAARIGPNVRPTDIRFHFDGSRIRAEKSPADYGMEEGDSIDAFMEQIGGK